MFFGQTQNAQHAGNFDYHHLIHIRIASAIINQMTKSWEANNGIYLFNHKDLDKVFRGKLLSKLTELNIKPLTVIN